MGNYLSWPRPFATSTRDDQFSEQSLQLRILDITVLQYIIVTTQELN